MRNRTTVEFQKGHYTKAQNSRRTTAEEMVKTGCDLLEKPPRILINNVAKKKWKEIVPQLIEVGLVTNLDLHNLIGFCNAYANYERATKELAASTLTVESKTGDKLNPLVNAVGKFSEGMRRYEALIGLTLDSRLKIANKKVESTENSIQSMFGVI